MKGGGGRNSSLGLSPKDHVTILQKLLEFTKSVPFAYNKMRGSILESDLCLPPPLVSKI